MNLSEGKVAIVTGAASGFGFEFAKLLAADGFNLVLVDKNLPGLELARQKLIASFRVHIQCFHQDLSERGAASKLHTAFSGPEIEVLINSAGFGLFGHFTSTRGALEEQMLNLHVLNLSQITKLYFRDMKSRGGGRIMNISSVAAFQPGPLMAVYYASKAYILSLTMALACEARGTGVTITAFCPGQTRTRFQQTVAELSGAPLSKSPVMADPAVVAASGYRAFMKGKSLSIPGAAYKTLTSIVRLLPLSVSASAVRKIQEKVRS